MPYPCSLLDLQLKSYVECPAGSELPAKRVKVCSSPADPVFVSPVDASAAAESVLRIVNDSYAVPSAIQSIGLTDNTKYFEIKHRNQGNIEFSFDPLFTTYYTVIKGNSYKLEGLNTNSETIYYRSSKAGTVELIECSV